MTTSVALHDVVSEIRFDPEAVQPLSEATLAACNAKMYATETTRTVAATEDSRPTCSDFVSTFQTSVTGTTSKDLADSDTGTSVAATTPQASRNGAEATPFNAWGPNGQPATRRKAVTVVSAVTSTVGGTRPRDRPDGPSGWARPVSDGILLCDFPATNTLSSLPGRLNSWSPPTSPSKASSRILSATGTRTIARTNAERLRHSGIGILECAEEDSESSSNTPRCILQTTCTLFQLSSFHAVIS